MRAAKRKTQPGASRLADRRTHPASATSTATLWKPTYDEPSSRIQKSPKYDARVMKSEKPRRGPSEKFSAIVPGCRARKSGTALGVKCRGVRRARRGYQFWDFENYLAETDHQNEIQAVYTNERQSYGNLISQYRKDGAIWTPSYYQYDALGSTRALTDDSGDATDTYVYDAWGNEVDVVGSTVNPFRWVGRIGYYWDEASGTFYIRARVYEPVSGRWMSQDPLFYPLSRVLVFSHGPSLYAYVGSSPLSNTDPTGKSSHPIGVGAEGKTCGATMRDIDGTPLHDPDVEVQVDHFQKGISSPQELIDLVEDGVCCSLWLVGHTSRSNYGKVYTFPESGGDPNNALATAVQILPATNSAFYAQLKQAFAQNGCTNCAINLITCGHPSATGASIRQQIADDTGCLLCGTDSKEKQNLEHVTTDPCKPHGESGFKHWPYKCYPPKNGGWEWACVKSRWVYIHLVRVEVCLEYGWRPKK